MPEKESEFQYTRVLWGSRAVGGVMVMALADWLDLGVVGGVICGGSGQLAVSKGGR